MTTFRRILVVTDFDVASQGVVEAAAGLAGALAAPVSLLCVLEALMYSPPEMAAWAERNPRTHPEVTAKMADAVRLFHERGVTDVETSIEYGIAVDVILRHANGGGSDLLVIGSSRHGVTASYLIPRCKIPVMTIPLKK